MADARQCDRCGKFYPYDGDGSKRIACKIYSGLNRRIYLDDPNYCIDLCDSCLNSLKGWWTLKCGENSKEDK